MSEWETYAEERTEETPKIGDNMKAVLESQVRELWEAEQHVSELEDELKAAKSRVRNISEQQIPSTFEDMGLDDESTVSVGGVKVTIRQSVHASPKAEDRAAVYDWLEEHGHGGLIKRTGIFKTGRDNEEKFKRWISSIKTYPGEFNRKVEPATLKAFVNEQLAAGVEIPMELFGAYTRRTAKVKSG